MTRSTRRRAAAVRPALTPALSPIALAAALALLVAMQPANAQPYVWTGAGGSGGNALLPDSTNWSGNKAPPATGADLAFGASASNDVYVVAHYDVGSLTFRPGASAYIFLLGGDTTSGPVFTVGAGGIIQSATAAQTFRDPVQLGANQTWTLAAGAGALNFLSGVYTNGGPSGGAQALTIAASSITNNGNGNVVNGVISGDGSLTKTGSGILTLSSASTYTGNTTVSAGVLAIGSGAGIQGGDLTVAGGLLAISGSGKVSPSGTLKVDGAGGGSSPELSLNGSASLSTGGVAYVGYLATGLFSQSGGSFTTNGSSLVLGFGVFGNSSGTYNLSGNTSTVSTGSAYVGYGGSGTFNQTGGSFTTSGNGLTLGYLAGSSGTYNLNGGTLNAGSVVGGSGTSTFNFNGGTLQAAGASTSFMQGLSTANVQAGGATIDSNGYNITIAQNLLHDTTPGAAALDGGLTKLGAGTLTLTGANTFTGDVNIDAGTLAVASESNLGQGKVVNVNDSGTLQFTGSATLTRTYNLGSSTLTAGSGDTLTLRGATINGGFLTGHGTTTLANGSTLNGVTTLFNSVLTQSGNSVTISNSTLNGSFSQSGTLALNGSTLGGSGTLTVGGLVRATDTALQGHTTLSTGGELDVVGGTLSLANGSVTIVNSGATLAALPGTSIELNGGQLVNNGKQSGVLDINANGVASGSGSFGTVDINKGGTFSAGNGVGSASATNVSFASGGRYEFDLNTAHPSFGSTSDLLTVTNTLAIDVGDGSPFTIDIDSLNLANKGAALSDFDSSRSYQWLLVDANAVSGFDASDFYVDTGGFSNSLNGGSFSVSLSGGDLYLDFDPTAAVAAVPEPKSWAMLLAGIATVAGLRLRQRRRAG